MERNDSELRRLSEVRLNTLKSLDSNRADATRIPLDSAYKR